MRHLRRLGLTLSVLAGAPAALAQTTWLVSNDPSENPDFPGLYEALESPIVVDGDTIVVSQGLGPYSPPVDQNYRFNKHLTVQAEPNERPILAVNPSTAVCCVSATIELNGSTLDGFDIYCGVDYAIIAGGSPQIRNCRLGGVGRNGVMLGGAPVFTNCEFRGMGGLFGPSLSLISASFVDCLFIDCWHGNGGIVLGGPSQFIRCTFDSNQAGGIGAEIACHGALYIDSCRFLSTSGPSSLWPGGLIEATGNTTIVNSLFAGSGRNEYELISVGTNPGAQVRLANCTFVGNRALHLISTGATASNTVSNSVFWGNTLLSTPFQGAMTIKFSNVQGGWAGTGNIDANPLFMAPGQGDYGLSAGSPCIDRADASALPPGRNITDLAGKPRFFDDPATSNNNAAGTPPYLDMGAIEYQGPFICLPDLTTTANPFAPGFGTPNGILNNDDFFFYLLLFEDTNPQADMTTTAIPGTPGYGMPNGVINNDDFFYYLSLFAAGCAA